MKKLKIRGITSLPHFISRWQGYVDGKRGAARCQGDRWSSHFLELKKAALHTFVHSVYQELEKNTADLRQESTSLIIEYEALKEQVAKTAEEASVPGGSIQARDKARRAAALGLSHGRLLEISGRLAEIDELLIHRTGEAAAVQRRAAALAAGQIQAYLHGAARALQSMPGTGSYELQWDFDWQQDLTARHERNDDLRRHHLAALTEVT